MLTSALLFGIAMFIFCTWGLKSLKDGMPLLIGLRGRFQFTDGPEAIANTKWDRKTLAIIDGLVNFGFAPLGIKVEIFQHRTTSEIALASSERQVFASIHGYRRGDPHYYLYTPFEDGAVVVTSEVEYAGVRTDRFIHAGTSEKEMAIVLAEHEKNVRTMASPERQPFRQYDQEARIRATELYYANPDCGILTRGIRLRRLVEAGLAFAFVLTAGAVAVWEWLPFIGIPHK